MKASWIGFEKFAGAGPSPRPEYFVKFVTHTSMLQCAPSTPSRFFTPAPIEVDGNQNDSSAHCRMIDQCCVSAPPKTVACDGSVHLVSSHVSIARLSWVCSSGTCGMSLSIRLLVFIAAS